MPGWDGFVHGLEVIMLRRAEIFLALIVGMSTWSCASDALNEGCADICAKGSSCVNGVCKLDDGSCAEVCAKGSSCVEGVCKLDDSCDKPCEGVCCAKDEFCSLATGECELIIEEEIKDCSTCKAYETCVNNACVACPNVVCGDACCRAGWECDERFVCYDPSIIETDCQITGCGAGESCDDLYPTTCFSTCDDGRSTCGYQCCEDDQICDASKSGCYRQCDDSRDPCGYEQICCAANMLCSDDDVCVPDCAGQGKGALCGDVCCDLGSVCDSITKTCLADCSAQQTRCGSGDKQNCCDNASEICYNNACIKRGAPCSETLPCDSFSDYCDGVTSTCVDMNLSPTHCIYQPPVGQFTPEIQWRYGVSVLGSAIVINLTDDNGDNKIDEHDIPDVVFVDSRGYLTVLSGDDGSLLAKTPGNGYAYRNDLGAAKINDDEYPEIVVGSSEIGVGSSGTSKDSQNVVILNLLGTKGNYRLEVIQELAVGTTSYGNFTPADNSTDLHPSFVDVNNDKKPEIVTNRGIIGYNTSTKKYEFNCTLTPTWTASYGANYLDDIIVADLDGDGQAELISRNIYDNKCQIILPHSAFPASSAEFSDSAHHFAVADLTDDGKPEIVRVADTRNSKKGTVYTMYKAEISIWKPTKIAGNWSVERLRHAEIPIVPERAKEANCGTVAAPRDCDCLGADRTGFFCNAWGGPPVIADFDGDGKPDIGLASTWAYYVYRNDLSILWKDTKTQDWSSGRTGSSVFDFEGDGISEVVYRDELKLRVYAGPGDGAGGRKILFETTSTSPTITEYPLIVDVDNDGNTEIVMVSNEGVTAYRDTADNWIRTRRIWNQHSYHVTNINEDGTVPSPEKANWLVKGLNNYRQNVQTEGMFNAPNLVAVRLLHSLDNCAAGNILLHAEVANTGALGVPAGVVVNFYMRTPGLNSGVSYVGQGLTTEALGIGETTTVSLNWNRKVTAIGGSTLSDAELPGNLFFIVDGSASGQIGQPGAHNECHEDDNTLVDKRIEACPIN